MESNQNKLSQEEMLAAIYENSRKTMNYMKWQLYITVVLIVLPILAMAVLVPFALKLLGSIGSIYLNGIQ